MSGDTTYETLVERLASSELDDDTIRMIEAALDGLDSLDAVVRGDATSTPIARSGAFPVAPAGPRAKGYLTELRVRGFRGIGGEAVLPLPAGNGLTLVLGRNGSGKSSFAEGLELLLTGENSRWHKKTAEWRAGWKNLHTDQPPRLRASFTVEGRDAPIVVERAWTDDVIDSGRLFARQGDAAITLGDLGWADGLSAFRPFLPYAELAGWADQPSQLHDAVVAVLGLDAIDDAAGRLDTARKRLDERRKKLDPWRERLRGQLDACDDDRARAALGAFGKRKVKLDALDEALLAPIEEPGAELPALRALSRVAAPPADKVSEVCRGLRAAEADVVAQQATTADHAHQVATLLRTALATHATIAGTKCPVCQTEGVLGPKWRADAEARAKSLEDDARAVTRARERLERLLRDARALTRGLPDVGTIPEIVASEHTTFATAHEAFAAALAGDDAGLLADQLESARDALDVAATALAETARLAIAEREAIWAPIARELHRFADELRAVEAVAPTIARLKVAREWLLSTMDELRNARFAPIKERARALWQTLRAGSNVDIVDLTLSGRGNRRKVDLDIAVDDARGVALGVMSQGELHALALSLFLPRACLDGSPFGFVVIDDPVQSMDAARVDGLARALESAAAERQVIVFTHDDRLFEAVRRLGITATPLWVDRGPGSHVEVRPGRDPIQWFIDDARAIARDPKLSGDVVQRTVPGLCRLALDTALCSAIRRAQLGKGRTHTDVDAQLDEASKLVHRASLLFFGVHDRSAQDVTRTIRNRYGDWAADAFHDANRGAHSGHTPGDPTRFVNDCDSLARKLEGRMTDATPRMLLDSARKLLDSPGESISQAWTRAAALLLRQALEGALHDLWLRRAESLRHAHFSVQLACFAEYTSDKALAADTRRTWHALSEVCHYRGYGMPPSRESLTAWANRVDRLVNTLSDAENA